MLEDNEALNIGAATWRWVAAALDSVDALRSELANTELHRPILILSGKQDTVVDPEYHRRYADELPNAQLITFSRARHEPYQEVDAIANEAIRRTVQFILDATPPPLPPMNGAEILRP